MEEKIKRLQEMINECHKIVFFGGAGVSTESGLKDFRSVDGIYSMKYRYPPEEILSHTFFMEKPREFYKFYRDKLLYNETYIQPNDAHYKLAELEKKGKLIGVVTQNIDNLHTRAGSKNVVELHGTIMKNHCVRCGKYFEGFNFIRTSNDLPVCDKCGGLIKPDVVLYEEPLNEKTINDAISLISSADMLIIGGCSMTVYPAASFVYYFKGKYIVIINKSTTSFDENADLVINDAIGIVLSQIKVD